MEMVEGMGRQGTVGGEREGYGKACKERYVRKDGMKGMGGWREWKDTRRVVGRQEGR